MSFAELAVHEGTSAAIEKPIGQLSKLHSQSHRPSLLLLYNIAKSFFPWVWEPASPADSSTAFFPAAIAYSYGNFFHKNHKIF
jgi:hypothetical protein